MVSAVSSGALLGAVKGFLDARRAHKRRVEADDSAILLLADENEVPQDEHGLSQVILTRPSPHSDGDETVRNGRVDPLRRAVGADRIGDTYFDYHEKTLASSKSYSLAALSFGLVTGLVILAGIIVAIFGLIAPGVMIEFAALLPGGIAKLLYNRADNVRSEARLMYENHANAISREHRFRQSMEIVQCIANDEERDVLLRQLALEFRRETPELDQQSHSIRSR